MNNKVLLVCWSILAISTTSFGQSAVNRIAPSLVKAAVNRASLKFSNASMYANQEQWIGSTIMVTGSFSSKWRNDIVRTNRPYEFFTGQNEDGYPVSVIVYYDTLIAPKHTGADSTFSSITGYTKVLVLGTIQKCEQVISIMGILKLLPVLELQLVFYNNDYDFSRPVYAGREFRY